MNVRRLGPEITSKLRSGIAITTVAQCVEELVLNSLDAGSTCVAVRLDLAFYKIQVIDNGRGISREDLNLVGDRYATSKCDTLDDLDNTTTFGHRGETLASISEVSQEMTIASRTGAQETTFVKSFRGGVSTVERAATPRPSRGTTVMAVNFLHNMRVRQRQIHAIHDVERTRDSLEVLALVHPNVSFSLYNEASASWCLRVAKVSSSIFTFGQIFGNFWVPLLKPIHGEKEPFQVVGFVACRGYHNRNLQLTYVHRRRIVDEQLNKLVHDIFETVAEDSGSHFLNGPSYSSATFPVYLLEVDCPRNMYDLGLHPSKTLVKFQQFDVLKELLVDVVKRFMKEHVDRRISPPRGGSPPPPPPPKSLLAEGVSNAAMFPSEITVHDYGHSLHSLPAKRPFRAEDASKDNCDTTVEFYRTPPTVSRSQNMDSFTSDLDERRSNTCNCSSKAGDCLTERLPFEITCNRVKKLADGFCPRSALYLFENNEQVQLVPSATPICLSPAIASHKTILGRLVKPKDRQQRALKAFRDLQKYSHKAFRKNAVAVTTTSEESPSELHARPSSATEIRSEMANTVDLEECSARVTTAIAMRSGGNSVQKTKHATIPETKGCALIKAESTASFEVCAIQNPFFSINAMPAHPEARVSEQFTGAEAPSDVRGDYVTMTSTTSDTKLHEGTTNEELVHEQSKLRERAWSPALQPFQRRGARQSDRRHPRMKHTSEQDAIRDGDMSKENAGNDLGGPSAGGITSAAEATAGLSPASCQPAVFDDSTEQLRCDDHGFDDDDVSRNWIVSILAESNEQIYFDPSSGNSYFGQPSEALSEAYIAPIVPSNLLPLDVCPEDVNILSTKRLPSRPWNQAKEAELSSADVGGMVRDFDSLASRFAKWQNPILAAEQFGEMSPVLTMIKQGPSTDSFAGSATIRHSYCFTKSVFRSIQLVNQVDCKFLVCMVSYTEDPEIHNFERPNLLIMLDQHAIHERIRLEQMLDDANFGDAVDSLKATPLDPPLLVRLPSASQTARNVLGQKALLARYGVCLTEVDGDGDGGHKELLLHSLPSCLVERDASECRQKRSSVLQGLAEELILEISENIRANRTSGPATPKVVLNVLKSQACHGAVKFGNKLTMTVCKQLVDKLGQCKLPFQCAHGRPSITAVVDLQKMPVSDQVTKPNLSRLKQLMWTKQPG